MRGEMQSVPQRERGVSTAARHLTASAWLSANKQEVTLSVPKLGHAQLQTRATTVFMSICVSLTCRKKRCILKTWQMFISLLD